MKLSLVDLSLPSGCSCPGEESLIAEEFLQWVSIFTGFLFKFHFSFNQSSVNVRVVVKVKKLFCL